MIHNNITELIGKTPIIQISGIEGQKARIAVKVEAFNPGGSVKDRIAFSMIKDAEEKGLLTPGATIIEPTSGNTGVGLAWIGTSRGYKVILTMPDSMSQERRSLLKAYGATLVLTPGKEGMKGAIRKADELHQEIQGSVILGQFVNPANPAAHERTTGEEIWDDSEGLVDIFVSGAGTGGTVSGAGRALKRHKADIKIVAVEPSGSPVLSTGVAGSHKIQGIGAGFVPQTLDRSIIDEIITVKDEDAFKWMRHLSRNEGILAGISSGAALSAAVELARREENAGKLIVALLPDTGERYLSTGLFE